jgi:hypothetical protein
MIFVDSVTKAKLGHSARNMQEKLNTYNFVPDEYSKCSGYYIRESKYCDPIFKLLSILHVLFPRSSVM